MTVDNDIAFTQQLHRQPHHYIIAVYNCTCTSFMSLVAQLTTGHFRSTFRVMHKVVSSECYKQNHTVPYCTALPVQQHKATGRHCLEVQCTVTEVYSKLKYSEVTEVPDLIVGPLDSTLYFSYSQLQPYCSVMHPPWSSPRVPHKLHNKSTSTSCLENSISSTWIQSIFDARRSWECG